MERGVAFLLSRYDKSDGWGNALGNGVYGGVGKAYPYDAGPTALVCFALLKAGVSALGDSRIENIEAMRLARVPASMTLLRSPMLSQAERVVTHADVSFNTELDVIRMLSCAARKAGCRHDVVRLKPCPYSTPAIDCAR